MADDIFKSLLGKQSTPGSTWGELAGAYLSGGRKKDNRARNVLLASFFFNAAEASKQSQVIKNLEEMEARKLTSIANAQSNYKKYSELLAADKDIKEQTAVRYYDSQAEDWFNNPDNHDEGFDPREFEDRNSPMYRLKQDKKREYINSTLLPQHQSRMKSIEGLDIESEEDFLTPIKNAFRAEKAKIASPQNVSLVHKAFGALGIGDNEKYQRDYLQAKKEAELFNKKIEGIDGDTLFNITLNKQVMPGMTDTGYSIKLVDPYAVKKVGFLGLTAEELSREPVYNEFEFKNSDAFKALQTTSGRRAALELFNAQDKDKRTEEFILQTVTSAAATDAYNAKLLQFNALKNQDAAKPKKPEDMSIEDYQKTPEFIEWDKQYKPGGEKYYKLRQEVGLPTTSLDKYRDEVLEFIQYDKQILAKQVQLDSDATLSQEQRDSEMAAYRDQRIQEHVEKHAQNILTGGGMSKFLENHFNASTYNLDKWIESKEGQEAIVQLQATKKIPALVAETRIRNYRMLQIINSQQYYKDFFTKYNSGSIEDFDVDTLKNDLELEGIESIIEDF